MSFGVGVGDVIAVSQLAKSLWKSFNDSGDQFMAISTEVAALYLVLEEVKQSAAQRELAEEEDNNLQSLAKGCGGVLEELDAILHKFHEIGADPQDFKAKSKKAWKRFKWDEEQVNGFRSRIVSNVSMLNAFNGSLTSKQAQVIQKNVAKVDKRLEGLQLDQQHQKIADWLSPFDFSAQQNDFLRRRQEGTGQWLLESETFKTWVDGTQQTLFCPGIPGAGKTMMSSIVVDYIQNAFRNKNVGVAFIYCNYRRQSEQNSVDLLASLVKQLVRGQASISAELTSLYESHITHKSRPSLQQICEILNVEISRYSKVFLIIDALDECADTDGARSILLSNVRSLQPKRAVSLLATSRFIPLIMQEFKSATQLEIKASDADVQTYLRGHMAQLPSCVTKSVSLQEAIERSIIEAVDGMFLLAQLHLDSLKDKATTKAIKVALAMLPKGSGALDTAYDEAVARINNQQPGFRERADQLLTWIIFAMRPMTVVELQHALAVELDEPDLDEDNIPDADEMVSWCAGLVVVDEESQIIRLVHYTTQEYFERAWDRRSAASHTSIVKTCLSYLSYQHHEHTVAKLLKSTDHFSRSIILKDVLKHYPLLEYAAVFLLKHARGQSLKPIENRVQEFLMSPLRANFVGVVIMLIGNDYAVPSRTSGLHLAAGFGSGELLMGLLKRGLPADAHDDSGMTPLHWAVQEGNEAVVRLLLTRDDVDVNNGGEYCKTPLQRAAEAGNDTIMELLLAHPAINASGGLPWTPLHLAAAKGNDTILKLLLAHPAIEVNAPNEDGWTPLHHAATEGNDTIVELLLAHPAIEVNASNKVGWTPLHVAALEGDETIFKLLLAHPAIEVNAPNENGWTPLHHAAMKGNDTIVELLLARANIAINTADKEGYTPVLAAMAYRHLFPIKLLLSRDDIVVHPPTPNQTDKQDILSVATVRVWDMWAKGRLPEWPQAEKRYLELYGAWM